MIDPQELFSIESENDFRRLALDVFRFQAGSCAPYREYLELLGVDPQRVTQLEEIPFLPIEVFKSHTVYCAESPPEIIFSSSTTTGQTPSRHYVKELNLYIDSFLRCFESNYGPANQVAIFALLPSYLERKESSLIYMVKELIARGSGGFYLYDHQRLLKELAAHSGPKILLGVSYALWDLAEAHPTPLTNTIVMETGGMKGHRTELPRTEFHRLLCKAFSVDQIHSEYGMAELLSQAYSKGEGIFNTPKWMRIVIRELNDPLARATPTEVGGVNVIDLANLYSCSFIQTQDLGVNYKDGGFRILGRINGTQIRGCNLLVQ